MTVQAGPLFNLRRRLVNLPTSAKIIIGNSLVILVGAIGGTVITRHFTDLALAPWLILFFASVGVLLSILVNYWLVRLALRPLEEISQFVEEIHSDEQSMLGASINLDLTEGDQRMRQLASTLNSLIGQLEASNRQLRIISQRAISAQEKERKRIARSLHDDTIQALSTLVISLERLENQPPDSDVVLRERLAYARRLAADTINELRAIIHGLRPAILDDLGLVPAIRWYARSNLEQAGIQVDFRAPEDFPILAQEQNITLFRIAQEAINNVVRHSGAHMATITLGYDSRQICLRIEDDGGGFHAPESQGEAIKLSQWGLIGIQERVELVGGHFNITSAHGSGTKLEVFVPGQNEEILYD